MCEEWVSSFDAFLRDMGECPPGSTLDRVDVNGHYEPRNCRWATMRQQARSKTTNVLVNYRGQTMILKDFAARLRVDYRRLSATMRRHSLDAITAANLIAERRQ
jgi:hypothetical protein